MFRNPIQTWETLQVGQNSQSRRKRMWIHRQPYH
jgi:hypothetical protein